MIRRATLLDIPRLVHLGSLMHAESRFRVLTFDRDKLAALLQRIIVGELGAVFVSEKEGEVIGGFAGLLTEHWASPSLVAYDLGLFIEPAHRGGTSAARLVRAFVRWARENGAQLITLGISTGVHAEETAKLYEAIGGRRIGSLFDWSVEHVHRD